LAILRAAVIQLLQNLLCFSYSFLDAASQFCHFLLKLKDNKRFAARYEKNTVNFQAFTFIACLLVWLL
jgi:hypothetical protein